MKRHIKRVVLPFVTLTMLAVAPISSNHGRLLVPEAKVFREGESDLTKTVTYDFTQIDGFAGWTSSYVEHEVNYEDGTVIFSSADRQTGTITNMPVTKGQKVIYKLNVTNAYITSYKFTCKKWGSNAQTITGKASSDGTNFTGASSKSSTFVLENSPEFTQDNGYMSLQFTFSNTSKQVGIESLSVTYVEPLLDPTKKTLSYENCDLRKEIVTIGDSYSVPATLDETRNGYVFAGFYTDSEYQNKAGETITIEDDVTLYAKWDKIEYTGSYSVNSLINGEYYRIKGKVLQTYSSTAYIMDGESAMKVYSTSSVFNPGGLEVGSYVDVCGKYDSTKRYLSDLVFMDSTTDSVEDYSKLTSLDDVTSENEHRFIELNRVHLSTAFVSKSAKIEGSDVVIYYTNTNQLGGQTFAADDYVDVSGFVMMNGATKEIYISKISRIAKYTITFDGNGGNGLVSDTALVGEKFTRPTTAPTKEADALNTYEFTGWYTTKECTELFDFEGTPVSKNITVYAGWKAVAKPLSETFANAEALGCLKFGYTKHQVSGDVAKTLEFSSVDLGLGNGVVISEYMVDEITMTAAQGTSSYPPKFYTSDNTARFYNGNTISFTSDTKKILSVEFVLSGYAHFSGVENCEITGDDSNIAVVTDTSLKSLTIGLTDNVKVKSFKVNYETKGLIDSYSEFTNAQLQFKYDFDFTGDTTCEETGIFVTDDPEYKFTADTYDDEMTLEDRLLTDGAKCHRFVNDTKKSTFIVGINLNDQQYLDDLTAVPYVKVGGYYYFGKQKTLSVYSALGTYSTDTNLSEETRTIAGAFLAELNEMLGE